MITKLQLLNKVLGQLRLQKLESLSDLALSTFPYNTLNDFFTEAIIFLSFSYNIEYLTEDKMLVFDENDNANLEDNGIFHAKIMNMFYKRGQSYQYPVRISPDNMRNDWGIYKKVADVQNWSVIENDIVIAPQPVEKEIYIRHYRVLDFCPLEDDYIDQIPTAYTNVLVEYLTVCLASLLGKETAGFYKLFEAQELNALMTNEANYKAFAKVLPKNIRF